MNIKDIIGKGKIFEPPFKIHSEQSPTIIDAKGMIVASVDYAGLEWRGLRFEKRMEARAVIANHICDLLNREHSQHQRMCIRDRAKVCDLCHDCDIDVLNPGDTFAGY